VASGFHSPCGTLRELSRQASRRNYRWPGAAREMVRVYLNTPSKASGQEAHGAEADLKALITRIAAVSGNPRQPAGGSCAGRALPRSEATGSVQKPSNRDCST